MAGHTTPVTWEGQRVDAWVPEPLAGLELPETAPVVRATERAAAAVRRMGERSTGSFEAAARLLLRAEGLASSAIEGLRVRPDELAAAAAGADTGDVVGEVAGNLQVLTEALTVPALLTTDHLLAWHRRLMAHSPLPSGLVGAWRDRLGWVGGATPVLAAHVAAPPDTIDGLMEDLVAFVGRPDVDPVTRAAVAHAQFETIHPFADGNGRIGRALVGWILVRGLEVPVPPPVSVAFARDVGGYLSGLTLFRQGDLERWVAWFAGAVERSADETAGLLDRLADVVARWREAVDDLRVDAAARRLVEDLPAHPVVTTGLVAERLGTSEPTARTAIAALEERGILTAMASPPRDRPGRRPQWFAATEVLDLLGT